MNKKTDIKDFLSENNFFYNYLIKNNKKNFISLINIIKSTTEFSDFRSNSNDKEYAEVYEKIETYIKKNDLNIKIASISTHDIDNICILFKFKENNISENKDSNFYFLINRESKQIRNNIVFNFNLNSKYRHNTIEMILFKEYLEIANDKYDFAIEYEKKSIYSSDNLICQLFNFDDNKFIKFFFFNYKYTKEEESLFLLLNDKKLNNLYNVIDQKYIKEIKNYKININKKTILKSTP